VENRTLKAVSGTVRRLEVDYTAIMASHKPPVGLLNRLWRMHSRVFAQIAQQLGIRRIGNLADWQLGGN